MTGQFNALKVGQMVKVKGRLDSSKFVALEISMEEYDDLSKIEGPVQSIDYQKNSLRILNREILVPDGILVKDQNRSSTALKSVKAGDVVKLKGRYSEAQGFVPEKIKIQEISKAQELQGVINKIDQEKKTLDLLGLTVVVSDRTAVTAF